MNISINIQCRQSFWYILEVYIKLDILKKFWTGGSTGKNQGVGKEVKHHNLTQPKLYQTLQKFNCTLYTSFKA